MARTLLVVAVFVLLAAAGGVFVLRHRAAEAPPAAGTSSGDVYQCSMHPQIVSSEPGTCPICQMTLTKVDRTESVAPPGERRIVGYRHPMRPDVTSPVPAEDEMGMAYQPIYEDESASGSPTVPGHAPFSLSTERQQLIGVRRGRVERRALVHTVRTVGTVAYDPKLYAALIEYREARRSRAALGAAGTGEARDGADRLLRAVRLRLRQLGIDPTLAEELLDDRHDPESLLLPGRAAWVYLQVYEFELGLVRPGQAVELRAPSLPGRVLHATVAGIDPILDPMTRTARVRASVQHADGALRPESYVDARIEVPLGEVLAVPDGAVLDTGMHQIVFVVKGAGDFEPRAVTLGRDAGGFVEVLDGLAEGDEVVTSANFLIDSESRFRAALAAFAVQAGHAH